MFLLHLTLGAVNLGSQEDFEGRRRCFHTVLGQGGAGAFIYYDSLLSFGVYWGKENLLFLYWFTRSCVSKHKYMGCFDLAKSNLYPQIVGLAKSPLSL